MNSQKIDLSVIVPLYNEEESIEPLYQSLLEVLTKMPLKYELVFVDDGSCDRTVKKGMKIAKQDSNLKLIVFRKNFGQTSAMAAGIEHAGGDILITMDGDLQNDPADIPKFLNKINEGYDLVVGWRYKRQDKFITRKIPSKIANWLIGKLTGVPIKDNGCSLKAYRAEVIKNVPLYSEMHRFIPAMSSIAGANIAEIKVRHHPRKYGTSKYGLSRIYKVLLDLLTIKSIISISPRPIIGFGTLAIISGIFSLFFLLISIIQAFVTTTAQSLVVEMGVSMLFGVLSIFLLLSGMLCELIVKTGDVRYHQLSLLTAFKDVDQKKRKLRTVIDEEQT
ncbi:MAG: glycosyltransferase [Nitrosopumilaceae archaeon]|nr:glycosyltransferase family 2 protein [Nitrosopumilaceae archaeon]NIU86076.1 glycosyltransferase [Nitrosopumilaceae archaeon]NIX62346.1 glycosyltransferase [Nitrosopumilaceae archaeon]